MIHLSVKSVTITLMHSLVALETTVRTVYGASM